MNSTRPAGRGVLLAVAAGGLALGLVLHAGGAPDEPPAPIRFPRDEVRVADTIGGAQPRSLPERGTLAVESRPEPGFAARPAESSSRPDAPTAVSPERMLRALEELARGLDELPFERHGWDRSLRAHAASFGVASRPTLMALLAGTELSDGAILAGLELARLWPSERDALPEQALDLTRTLAAGLDEAEVDPRAIVGARLAVASGDGPAAEAALHLLLFGHERDGQEAARWILAANPEPAVAMRLADEVARLEAGPRMILVLRALAEMQSANGEPLLDEPLRFQAARGASVLLQSPDVELEAATGVLAALEAFAPQAVRGTLFDCIDSPRTELSDHALDRLVASGDTNVIERLGDRLLMEPDEALAGRLARALLPAHRADTLEPGVQEALGTALRREAVESADPRTRRRAVHGLGSLSDGESASALARVLTQDDREQVRVAAAAALGRHPRAAEHREALERAVEDSSTVVSRTAANVLRRFESGTTVARRSGGAVLLPGGEPRE